MFGVRNSFRSKFSGEQVAFSKMVVQILNSPQHPAEVQAEVWEKQFGGHIHASMLLKDEDETRKAFFKNAFRWSGIKGELNIIMQADGCVINTAAPVNANKPYACMKDSVAGTSSVGLHRMSKLLDVGRKAFVEATKKKFEVSHFCGNSMCFRADHLVLESSGANKSRQSCHRLGLCFKSKLKHSPPCKFAKAPEVAALASNSNPQERICLESHSLLRTKQRVREASFLVILLTQGSGITIAALIFKTIPFYKPIDASSTP
jgi:hypothetical protein